jgi:hypothetical protein
MKCAEEQMLEFKKLFLKFLIFELPSYVLLLRYYNLGEMEQKCRMLCCKNSTNPEYEMHSFLCTELLTCNVGVWKLKIVLSSLCVAVYHLTWFLLLCFFLGLGSLCLFACHVPECLCCAPRSRIGLEERKSRATGWSWKSFRTAAETSSFEIQKEPEDL